MAKFAEDPSLLKKSPPHRSLRLPTGLKTPETGLQTLKRDAIDARRGTRREHEGVFQQADPFYALG
jgi:hypothetical protein